jgi:hypothetical protein
MATVRGLSFLTELQQHDFAHVQFAIRVERNSPLAQIGTGTHVSFLRKNSITENAYWDSEVNALPVATVERWRQLRQRPVNP